MHVGTLSCRDNVGYVIEYFRALGNVAKSAFPYTRLVGIVMPSAKADSPEGLEFVFVLHFRCCRSLDSRFYLYSRDFDA